MQFSGLHPGLPKHQKPTKKRGKTAVIYIGYIKIKTPKYLYLSALSSDPGEARTLDPMIKSHLLYQLSYGVIFWEDKGRDFFFCTNNLGLKFCNFFLRDCSIV